VEIEDDYTYLGGGIVVDAQNKPSITLEDYLLKILQDGPMTRGELSAVTGIPRTTLYDTLVKLLMQNKVEKFSLSKHKRGRPNVYYRLTNIPRKQRDSDRRTSPLPLILV
jgi:predicted ArsR family transcriptional regulator